MKLEHCISYMEEYRCDLTKELDEVTDYVVKTYPTNVNEVIQKFVGEVIEW